MNTEQRAALEASIDHWKRMYRDPVGCEKREEWPGPINCACCLLWNKRGNRCEGCPVKEATGKPYCYGIAHADAMVSWEEFHYGEDAAEKVRPSLWLARLCYWREDAATVGKQLEAILRGDFEEHQCPPGGKKSWW
jgi:hypothetical protein